MKTLFPSFTSILLLHLLVNFLITSVNRNDFLAPCDEEIGSLLNS